MPETEPDLMVDSLRRLCVATLAYAVAVAVLAGALAPTFLHSHPVAALLPQPLPVVARSPAAPGLAGAPAPEAAL